MEYAIRKEESTSVVSAAVTTVGAVGLMIGSVALSEFLVAKLPSIHEGLYVSTVRLSIFISLGIFLLRKWLLALGKEPSSTLASVLKWASYVVALAAPLGLLGIDIAQSTIAQFIEGKVFDAVFFALAYVGLVWVCVRVIKYLDPINVFLCEAGVACLATCSLVVYLGAAFAMTAVILLVGLRICWAIARLIFPFLFLI